MSFDEVMMPPKNGPETGVWVRSIGGYCPCQADGTINGNPFYFRARHGKWTLDIVKPGEDPVLPENPLYHGEGADHWQGYMPIIIALGHIFDASFKFLEKQRRENEKNERSPGK